MKTALVTGSTAGLICDRGSAGGEGAQVIVNGGRKIGFEDFNHSTSHPQAKLRLWRRILGTPMAFV
jgi:hypothetical protein